MDFFGGKKRRGFSSIGMAEPDTVDIELHESVVTEDENATDNDNKVFGADNFHLEEKYIREIESLRDNVETLEGDIRDKKQVLSELEEEIVQKNKEMVKVMAEVADYSRMQKDCKLIELDIEDKRKELDSIVMQVCHKKEELGTYEGQIKDMEKELSLLKSDVEDSAEKNKKSLELDSVIGNKEKQAAELEKNIAEKKDQIKSLEGVVSELELTKQKLKSEIDKFRELSVNVESGNNKNLELENKYQDILAQRGELMQKLEEERASIEQYEENLSDKKKRVSELCQSIDKIEQERIQKETELEQEKIAQQLIAQNVENTKRETAQLEKEALDKSKAVKAEAELVIAKANKEAEEALKRKEDALMRVEQAKKEAEDAKFKAEQEEAGVVEALSRKAQADAEQEEALQAYKDAEMAKEKALLLLEEAKAVKNEACENEQEAEQMIRVANEAKAEAKRVMEEASLMKQQADDEEAKADAERVKAEIAKADAERILIDVQKETQLIKEEAEKKAEEIRKKAKAESDAVMTAADQVVADANRQIEECNQRKEDALRRLSIAQSESARAKELADKEVLLAAESKRMMEDAMRRVEEAEQVKREAEEKYEKATQAALKAEEIKCTADAMIAEAEMMNARKLKDAEERVAQIHAEAAEKYAKLKETDDYYFELVELYGSRNHEETVKNESEDESILSKHELKAKRRAEKKAQKKAIKAERREQRENRKMARRGYLPQRTQEQIILDAIQSMVDEQNLFGSARKNVKELIVCDGVNPANDGYLILNDGGQDVYVAVMYVNTNPRNVDFAKTYADIMNTKGVTTNIHIEPMLDGKASKTLDRKIVILDAEKLDAEKEGDRNRYRKVNAKMNDAESYAEDVEAGTNQMFEVTFLFVLHNTDKEKLMTAINELHGKASARGVELCSCYTVHPEAFVSAAPTNRMFLAEYGPVKTICAKKHTMDTKSLACIFNHTRSDFYHEDGIIAGRNMLTQRPATFDMYDRSFDSYGVVICGDTGTGKSATVKMYLTRFSDFDVKIASIDFEPKGSRGEYSRACEVVGGKNFVLKNGSTQILNPFELDVHEEYDESSGAEWDDLLLMDKISDATNLIMTMALYEMPNPEHATVVYYEKIIRTIVTELYDERGIKDHEVESLYCTDEITGKRRKKELPTIGDFYTKLLWHQKRNNDRFAEEPYALLVARMQKFVAYRAYTEDSLQFFTKEEVGTMPHNEYGQRIFRDASGKEHPVTVVMGTCSFFDGQSSIQVNLDTPWVNIDISQLPECDRPIAEAVSANYLNENFIKRNSCNPNKAKKRIILIDEVHKMFPHEFLRKFLGDLYRTARKRLISPWSVTQQLIDFKAYDETKAIVEQASTIILLKQDEAHADYIKEVTKMTDAQISFLASLGGNPLDKSQGNTRKGELCMTMKGHASFIKVDYLEDSEFDVVETDMLKIQQRYKERKVRSYGKSA